MGYGDLEFSWGRGCKGTSFLGLCVRIEEILVVRD